MTALSRIAALVVCCSGALSCSREWAFLGTVDGSPPLDSAVACGGGAVACGTQCCAAATEIAAGSSFVCALVGEGDVKCWGRKFEEGFGSTAYRVVPSRVGLIVRAQGLAAGNAHACVVTSDRAIKCWGDNLHGQVGNGTSSTTQSNPAPVGGLGGEVLMVTAGTSHTCALLVTGAGMCWGENAAGQFGNGSVVRDADVTNPTDGFAAGKWVSAGSFYTCGIGADGGVACAGNNGAGELGIGRPRGSYPSPTPCVGLGADTSAIIGSRFNTTCAIDRGGALRCWGDNWGEKLAGESTADYVDAPVLLRNAPPGVSAVATGRAFVCAVSRGEVWCWGSNANGQLGNPAATGGPIPVRVEGIVDATAVTAGDTFACALRSNGGVLCWGGNDVGQLGDGTTEERRRPVAVVGL
jgi:alpha-tubulin suppressor-like RCC1 family protein